MEQGVADKQLRVSYDRDADVLYVSFGAPQEAISREVGDGMLLRTDPNTGDVVGVTVVDFEKRFGKPTGSALLPVVLDRVRAA